MSEDLILPIPPEDIMEKLILVADMEPQTVAVWGAVDFVGGMTPVLRKALDIHIEKQRLEQERIDWLLNDPIVYVTRGPVTAVVCQFGPFPIEQAIIDRVKATDFLPISI